MPGRGYPAGLGDWPGAAGGRTVGCGRRAAGIQSATLAWFDHAAGHECYRVCRRGDVVCHVPAAVAGLCHVTADRPTQCDKTVRAHTRVSDGYVARMATTRVPESAPANTIAIDCASGHGVDDVGRTGSAGAATVARYAGRSGICAIVVARC